MNIQKTLEEIKPYFFTVFFVAINIIVFLICTFTGSLLYNKGAFYVWNILKGKEYYRLVTAVFLHYDITHIINNMLLLFFMGRIVEKQTGHFAYFIIYMLSGIGGNIVSGLWEYHVESYSISVGASGAVFGLTGALLVAVICNKGKIEQIRWQGVLLMIFLSVYNGFAADNINNAAHLGGLLIGIITTAIVSIGRIKRES